MNKKVLVVLIILVWAIALGGFIAYKEYTLRTGEVILLKTMPVDPRDLFRGDYVVLTYEISRLDSNNFPNRFPELNEGDIVYVELQKGEKYWTAVNIYKENPNKTSIKGRVKNKHDNSLNMEYGIESFFVPEGEGRELENARNANRLDVQVSIDKFGNAVIKNLLLDDKVWIAP